MQDTYDAVKRRREETCAALAQHVLAELERSIAIHGGFASAHEGYAVLLEEVDELWEEVKKRNPDIPSMRKEAIQVAAMALKFAYQVGGTWP